MPISDLFEKLKPPGGPRPRGPVAQMTPGGPIRGPSVMGTFAKTVGRQTLDKGWMAPGGAEIGGAIGSKLGSEEAGRVIGKGVGKNVAKVEPSSRIARAFKALYDQPASALDRKEKHVARARRQENPAWATRIEMPTTARGRQQLADQLAQRIRDRVSSGDLHREHGIAHLRNLINENMHHPRAREWMTEARQWQDLEDQAHREQMSSRSRQIPISVAPTREYRDAAFYERHMAELPDNSPHRIATEQQLMRAYQDEGRFREADALREKMNERMKAYYKPEILTDETKMADLSKSGFRVQVRKGGELEGMERVGIYEFNINNKQGKLVGNLQATVDPANPERLYINTIGARKRPTQGSYVDYGSGQKGALGFSGMRDVERQLKAIFPKAKTVGGYRVTGARRASGSGPRDANVTLMEGLMTLFGAGAATGIVLANPDEAEASPWDMRYKPGALLGMKPKSGLRIIPAHGADVRFSDAFKPFVMFDKGGEEIGYVIVKPRNDDPHVLEIDNIQTEKGPKSVGPDGVKDILDQLRAVFPDHEVIEGNRISGARKQAGATGKAAMKLGAAGAVGAAALAGDDDQAQAADLGKISEMYQRFDKGARSFWLQTPEGGQGMYVRNAMRPSIDGNGMSKTLDIANVDFDPAERGKGNFTQYLDEIERSGKEQGFDQVHVENVLNKRLIPFLEKRGFQRDPYSFGGAPSFYKKLTVAGGAAASAAALGDDQAQAATPDMGSGLMKQGRERLRQQGVDASPGFTEEMKDQFLSGVMAAAQGASELAGDEPPGQPFESFRPEVAGRLRQALRNFIGKNPGEDFNDQDLRAWQAITGALEMVGGEFNAAGAPAFAGMRKLIDHLYPDASEQDKDGILNFAAAALPFGVIPGSKTAGAARTAGSKAWQITRQMTSLPIRKLMSPGTVSQTAADTAGIIRMRTGIGARFTEVTRGALGDDPTKGVIPNLFANFEKKINQLSDADQRSMLSYMEGRSAGSQFPAHIDPVLQGAADEVKHAMEDRETRLRALPRHAQMSFIDDYVAHYWDNPQQAQRFKQWWLSEGSRGTSAAGHTRRRTIPTIEDGISYGLKPITTNPIDISMRYVEQMDRYIAHMEILDEMENRGMLRWMPEGSHQIPDGWAPIRGKWSQRNGMPGVAPADAARVYNRFASLGIQGEFARPVYESVQATGNAITALELGMSGFHAVLMNVEAPMSLAATSAAQALGSIDKLARGQLADALRMLGGSAKRAAEATGLPLAGAIGGYALGGPAGGVAGMLLSGGLARAARGHKLQQTYLGRSPASASLAMRHVANLLTAAGGRAVGKGHTLREYQFSPAGSFFTQWKRMGFSGMGKSIARRIEREHLVPGTTTPMPKSLSRSINAMKEIGIQLGSIFETISQPLFETYIPKLKDGAFYDTMKAWLDANPTASLDDQLMVARKVWDSIDNRFGELVQDNIFWDKTAKQLAMLAMRSYSWNVGTVREIAGGALAAARGPQNAAITAGTKYDPRIGYVIALPVISALMGSVYYYMKNGKAPGDGTDDGLMRDLMVPRTGGRVAGVGGRGSVDERVQMPSYMRDVFGWYNDAKGEAMNKIATGPRLAGEMWSGKDWRGDPITRPDATMKQFVQDWLDHLFFGGNPMLGPITLRNLERGRERGSNISMTEQLLGLRPASAYLQDPRGLQRSREHREKTEWKRKGRYERKQERRREPSYGGPQE